MWYYYENDGQKRGPCSGGQLRQLVQRGTITPETIVKTEEGKKLPAKEVKGLFSETAKPVETETYGVAPPPAPPPVEANPFTAPMPTELNPFVSPTPVETGEADSLPIAKANRGPLWKPLIVLIILSAIAGTVGPIMWESYKLKKLASELVKQEVLEPLPLKNPPIAVISVKWDAPTSYETVKSFWGNVVGLGDEIDRSALGKFVIITQTKEKLYKSVSHEDGLRELGIAALHEKELDLATRKFRELPISYQNDLRSSIPKDLSEIRLFSLLVPEDEEILLTGSIKLTKDGKEAWRENGIQVDPLPFGDLFTAESSLLDAHKLDDLVTKRVVEIIVQARKEFVDNVEVAHDAWKFSEALNRGLIETGDMTLEITDTSIDWKDKTSSTASGKFVLKAKTTETLYASVNKKTALETLGIAKPYAEHVETLGVTEIYEKVVYEENTLIPLGFYEVLLPSGDEVTLTGSIELAKPNAGDWQATKIQIDSDSRGKSFTLESQLRNGYRLNDPTAKEAVETSIKNFVGFLATRIKQKDDFDNFCKGKKYTGDLKFRGGSGRVVSFSARVDFKEPIDPNANEVNGTITIDSPAWKGERPFTVSVNAEDAVADYPITGTINNSTLPIWDVFWNNVKAKITDRQDAEDCRHYYNLLRDNVKINIIFTNNGLDFSLTTRHGLDRTPLNLSGTRPSKQDVETKSGDRNWLLPIVKKWLADNAEAMQKPQPLPMTGVPGTRLRTEPGQQSRSDGPSTSRPASSSWQPGQRDNRQPVPRRSSP